MKFEVERFAVAGDDRLEVAGRWFGVRGRRFLRPTLEFESDGERRRELAVLDHKPWTAEDGEKWVAAFQWDGVSHAPAAAELAVSTDLSVTLGDEGSSARVEPAPVAAPRPEPGTGPEQGPEPEKEPEPEVDAEQRAAGQAALRRARSDLEAMRAELEAARSLGTERDLQTERLRDELARISGERDGLRAELDSATASRKGAASATERARVQRDKAQQRIEATESERDEAVARLDRAEERRLEAEAELESTRAERDAARALRRAPLKASDPEPAAREPAEWRVRAMAAGAVAVPLLILIVLTALDM